jgi:hypothetical protein
MKLNNVVIFGDSYSTYAGHIPSGYDVYYSGKRATPPDLSDVSKTWWHQVISENGATLVQNNSWSGSTIGYTGYGCTDRSASSSFIYRFNKMVDEGFFKQNKVDSVLIFGGTNDSWCQAPVGQLQFSDWSHDSLFFVLPAVCHFFSRLKEELPEAQIVCIINTNLKDVICKGMKKACEHYGIKAVVLKDIDKLNGHPTEKGMAQIKEQVINAL